MRYYDLTAEQADAEQAQIGHELGLGMVHTPIDPLP
jgi:hypothetical protein